MTERLTTSDGIQLAVHPWPVPEPKAVVALVHGYAEHGERYLHVAKQWNERGLSVVGIDLRGHGRSEGQRGHVDTFSQYHHDMDALLGRARTEAAGRPVFMFGHSMGGLLSCHYLILRKPHGIRGLMLSSPYLGLALAVPPAKKIAARLFSRAVPKLSLSSGLKGTDLTRDPEMVRIHDEDPLNFPTANARWFMEANDAMRIVLGRAREIDVATLLLYGGEDRIASANATDAFAVKLRMPDKETERLPGFFHEIVNEPLEDRDRIIRRMADWMLARVDGD